MKHLIQGLVLILALNCLAGSNEEWIGLDKPIRSTHVELEKSATTEGNIKFSCWEYSKFAVAQINDPGTMGAIKLEIRSRKLGKSSNICSETQIGKGIVLDEVELNGYYIGSSGGFLFIGEPDSFGNQLKFRILSMDGKEVLKESRDLTEPVLIQSKGRTSVSFFKNLQVNCQLAKEGRACWKKIIADNKIPGSLKLPMPDCLSAFKKEKSPLDNNALVSSKVEIANLRNPKIKYTGGFSKCTPAP
jgi:hypothetical protein